MVSTTITNSQILSILQSDPFRRFSMSDLQPHLPAQSLPDLQKAMVEGKNEVAGNVRVGWLSYFGD
jgi:hypothetical protein